MKPAVKIKSVANSIDDNMNDISEKEVDSIVSTLVEFVMENSKNIVKNADETNYYITSKPLISENKQHNKVNYYIMFILHYGFSDRKFDKLYSISKVFSIKNEKAIFRGYSIYDFKNKGKVFLKSFDKKKIKSTLSEFESKNNVILVDFKNNFNFC